MRRGTRTSAGTLLVAALALLLVAPALASDSPAAPTPLSFGSPAYFDTSGYGVASGEQNTTSPFPNSCGAPYDVGVARTAWLTVPGTGGPITVTTAGSNYDTALFVYAGSPAGPVVACNDDSASGIQAELAFASTAGVTYAIQVGRACNDGSTPNCATSPSAGALTITARGTPSSQPAGGTPGTGGPDPGTGTPGTGTPGAGAPGTGTEPSAPASTPVQNRLVPAIDGVAVRGRPLTCKRGEWLGVEPLAYTFEWLRDGRVVGRRFGYKVVAADVGRRLTCRVTASSQGASGSAISEGVTPAASLRAIVLIPTGGHIDSPDGKLRRKDCRGKVDLTLFKGRRRLGHATVLLKSDCRWSHTWQVSRRLIGRARRLTVAVRFPGNKQLLPVSGSQPAKVPGSK